MELLKPINFLNVYNTYCEYKIYLTGEIYTSNADLTLFLSSKTLDEKPAVFRTTYKHPLIDILYIHFTKYKIDSLIFDILRNFNLHTAIIRNTHNNDFSLNVLFLTNHKYQNIHNCT